MDTNKIEKLIRSKMKNGGGHKYMFVFSNLNEIKLDGVFTLDDLEIIVHTVREQKQKYGNLT